MSGSDDDYTPNEREALRRLKGKDRAVDLGDYDEAVMQARMGAPGQQARKHARRAVEDEDEDEDEDEMDEMLQPLHDHTSYGRQLYVPESGDGSMGIDADEDEDADDDELEDDLDDIGDLLDEEVANTMANSAFAILDEEAEASEQALAMASAPSAATSSLTKRANVSIRDIQLSINHRRRTVKRGVKGVCSRCGGRGVECPAAEGAMGQRRRADELPPFLQHSMGAAMDCFTNRDFGEAKKYLNEIIRHAPKVASSYRLLALIAKEEGDPMRELQYQFFGATFSSEFDFDAWIEVAEMSKEYGLYEQAILCYEKIWRKRPTDINALVNLAQLNTEIGKVTKAILHYKRILELSSHNMQIIVPLARLHTQRHEEDKAAELFEAAFASQEGHDHYQLEHVNYLAELYGAMGRHRKTIELLDKEEELADDDFPLDLIVKRTVAHIRLNGESSAAAQLGLQYLNDTDDFASVADLYLEVAKAYRSIRKFDEALEIFAKLVMIEQFNTPDVWMNQALCHLGKGDAQQAQLIAEEAIAAGDPNNPTLKELIAEYKHKSLVSWTYREDGGPSITAAPMAMGRKRVRTPIPDDDALDEQNDGFSDYHRRTGKGISGKRQPRVNNARQKWTEMLQSKSGQSSWPEFIEDTRRNYEAFTVAQALRPRDNTHLMHLCDRLWGVFDLDTRAPGLALLPTSDGVSAVSEPNTITDANSREPKALSSLQWLTVATQFASLRLASGDARSAYELLWQASREPIFSRNDSHQADLRAAMIVTCLCQDDTHTAVEHARWFCHHKRDVPLGFNVFWATFARVPEGVALAEASSTIKYVVRHARLAPASNISAKVGPGHQYSIHRSFANSLDSYVSAWSSDRTMAPTNLLLGITTLQQAMQRITPNRHVQIAQGIAFMMRYYMIREGNQEANYNLGRAFQGVGLFYLARPFYEAALEQTPLTEEQCASLSAKALSAFDLRRECAWNLVTMYMRVGNELMAADLVRRHLIVT